MGKFYRSLVLWCIAIFFAIKFAERNIYMNQEKMTEPIMQHEMKVSTTRRPWQYHIQNGALNPELLMDKSIADNPQAVQTGKISTTRRPWQYHIQNGALNPELQMDRSRADNPQAVQTGKVSTTRRPWQYHIQNGALNPELQIYKSRADNPQAVQTGKVSTTRRPWQYHIQNGALNLELLMDKSRADNPQAVQTVPHTVWVPLSELAKNQQHPKPEIFNAELYSGQHRVKRQIQDGILKKLVRQSLPKSDLDEDHREMKNRNPRTIVGRLIQTEKKDENKAFTVRHLFIKSHVKEDRKPSDGIENP